MTSNNFRKNWTTRKNKSSKPPLRCAVWTTKNYLMKKKNHLINQKPTITCQYLTSKNPKQKRNNHQWRSTLNRIFSNLKIVGFRNQKTDIQKAIFQIVWKWGSKVGQAMILIKCSSIYPWRDNLNEKDQTVSRLNLKYSKGKTLSLKNKTREYYKNIKILMKS